MSVSLQPELRTLHHSEWVGRSFSLRPPTGSWKSPAGRTGRHSDQEQDIIRGLNLGADDDVTKPFQIGELMARAEALLRRHAGASAEMCRFGDWVLGYSSHRLLRTGLEVELTPKEFSLLSYFVTHAGRALTRKSILDVVWGDRVMVTEHSVDRCVRTLRAKQEADAARPMLIQTIPDIGYRFELPLDE